jgi:hypothetical protein
MRPGEVSQALRLRRHNPRLLRRRLRVLRHGHRELRQTEGVRPVADLEGPVARRLGCVAEGEGCDAFRGGHVAIGVGSVAAGVGCAVRGVGGVAAGVGCAAIRLCPGTNPGRCAARVEARLPEPVALPRDRVACRDQPQARSAPPLLTSLARVHDVRIADPVGAGCVAHP